MCPATAAGTVTEVLLKRGDKVSKGSLIARVEASAAAAAAPAAHGHPPRRPLPRPRWPRLKRAGDTVRMPAAGGRTRRSAPQASFSRTTQLLVLGSGPGGYTAAFRAADLGLKVTLVERWPSLGGVCLNVGCIPSKALLHAAKVIEDARRDGRRTASPSARRRSISTSCATWKSQVVRQADRRPARCSPSSARSRWSRGSGRFVSPNVLEVMGSSGSERIRFEQCIIAAGSEAMRLPGLPDDPRIIDSTDALELPEFAGGLLVIGGGIIGLEMACVLRRARQPRQRRRADADS